MNPTQRVGRARERRQHVDRAVGAAGTARAAASSSIARERMRALSVIASSSSASAAAYGSRAPATTSSSSASNARRRDATPPPARAAARRRSRGSRRAAGRAGASRRSPVASRCARCAPIAAHSSSMPVAGRRDRAHDRRPPRRARPRARASPRGRAPCRVDAGPVGLVHDEHVGDLEQPGLRGLHRVAPTGVHDDDRRVGVARDLDLDLADADRLDDDPRLADRVEHAHRLRRRDREPAEVTARRHRADEHAGVGRVLLHADAVTEDRAAAERAARVDREHADRRRPRRGCARRAGR